VAGIIATAPEIRDPLDGLAERSVGDPGAPFAPEVLERLADLRHEDRAGFELLRARLKKAGCRVAALDQAIAGDNQDSGRGPRQADILVELAETAALFHAPDKTATPISTSTAIARPGRCAPRASAAGWRGASSRPPGARPTRRRCQSAINVIEAKAHYEGPERNVFVRVGGSTAVSISISATRPGARSRSTPGAGASSTRRRCASAAPPACRPCRSRCRADLSRRCAASSMSATSATSCW